MSQSAYLSNYEPTPSYATLSYFDFEQHAREWQEVISTHSFNHKLSVFLPFCDTETTKQYFNETTIAGSYYQVQLPLASILDPDFLSNVIRSDTHLDSDNVVTIDQHGKLIFSLLKSTYESFGIVAEHGQNKQDRLRQKYIVTVDLHDRKLVPNTKKYNRLKSCIENTFTEPFKAVATWIDRASGDSKDIPWPNTIVSMQKKSMDIKLDSLNYINIPTFDELRCSLATRPDSTWQYNTFKALEWVGLANIKANRITVNDKPECFVSVYNPPTSASTGLGTLMQWTGLIHPLFISHILISLKKMLLSKKELKWVSLSTWGYRDSPFTWESHQHYYFTNGENDYTFVLLSPGETEGGDGSLVPTIGCQMYGSDHIQK
ncbi:ribonuclease P 40kDa subunit-domain-containing protein [Phascolomyces articulosus]|uniref:Ribonuclease P 40kDa subunit-domain-containing protein n=1 Tax=Phascolomyces articulosus TaxID=60185 RepID=A0AAD5KK41_9FUNG|nr:ribonuclease P 40kDa subunit-domain-containing protein [Phascolomyces articulosus]